MGAQRLPGHLRRLPAARRTRGRPDRAPPPARGRHRPCSRCARWSVGSRRTRPARRRPRRAGHRRRADGTRRAVDPDHHLHRGQGPDTALGVWGAISGVAAAAGVFLGGVLSEGPGWRWVLFVNIPSARSSSPARSGSSPATGAAPAGHLRRPGAVLVTAAMLLLVYALVKAPQAGWGTRHTIGELGTAAVLFAAFVVVERRTANPLVPVRHLPHQRTGRRQRHPADRVRRLPVDRSSSSPSTCRTCSATPRSRAAPPTCPSPPASSSPPASPPSSSRASAPGPVIVAGALLAAAGMYYLSRIPVRRHLPHRPAARPRGHVDRSSAPCSSPSPPPPTPASRPTRPDSPPACSTPPCNWAPRSDWPSSPPSRPPRQRLLQQRRRRTAALTSGFRTGSARRQHRAPRRRPHRPTHHRIARCHARPGQRRLKLRLTTSRLAHHHAIDPRSIR